MARRGTRWTLSARPIPRRAFLAIAAGGLLAAPLAAGAQSAANVARLGFLSINVAVSPHLREAFLQGLRALGYVEGRSVVIEYRDAQGQLERLPALAAELAVKADVIVVPSTAGAMAAKQATGTVPIVFISVSDPVASRLVNSLASRGGNVTGLSALTPALVGKCLELLKQPCRRSGASLSSGS
jgi:putative ABC transport system substrate-binding protein